MSGSRRVVVTGIGVLTPVGLDVESTWKNLLAGTSGIDLIQRFDTTQHQVKIAGEIKDFEPKEYMDHKMARRSGRFAQLAVAASKQALCSAALEIDDSNRDEIGVIVASAGGAFEMGDQENVIKTRGAHRVNPLLIPKYGA